MTQISQIENHLKDGFTITPLDALKMYGCFRLADVVFKLKKKGMNIVNDGTDYAIYRLIKEGELI